jgi:DNA modification methylase
MGSVLCHETCEERFDKLGDQSIDAIITDVPYNVSELAVNEQEVGGFHDRGAFQRYYGEWDRGFDMSLFVDNAWRVLHPGGWLITFCSDRLIGPFRDFASGDHSTTKSYLRFLLTQGIIDSEEFFAANGRVNADSLPPPRFDFKATVTWKKTNPPTSVRKSTLISSCEYILIARKTDCGKAAKPVAWNWLGTKAMWNHFEGPLCQEPERVYWHNVDGQIVTCKRRSNCEYCKAGVERERHGTQKPLYTWRWIYARYTKPEMRIYDPYAGLATGGWTAKEYKLDWIGSEADPIYAKVGQMLLDGTWDMPREQEIEQCRL